MKCRADFALKKLVLFLFFMKKKSLSISDIARRLNISVTTVSFIINGKAEEKRISSHLTQQVLALVQELGYVPNQLAKSLRTGKTNIIALIVEDISNPFFANVARLIEEKANKKRYKIIYCSSENDAVKMSELIKVFRERQVDGFIITPTEGVEGDIRQLLNDNHSLILFDRFFPDLDTNYVIADNEYGAYSGIKHLITRGYKKIGFVTIDSTQTQMSDRLAGYTRAIDEYGLKSYVKKVSFFDSPEVIIKKISAFLMKPVRLDAVFFATNYLGIHGLEAITNMHLKIPSDIAVVSFDDHDLFRLFSPSVTVVAQPIEEMSNRVIEILLDQLESSSPKSKGKKVSLKPKLIIRKSS